MTFTLIVSASQMACDYENGGYATSATALEISTAQELSDFAAFVNDGYDFSKKYVKLTADINLNSVCGANVGGAAVNWTPIGTAANPFRGNFDGCGKEISNLYYNGSATDGTDSYVGLFGYTAAYGEIPQGAPIETYTQYTIENIELTGVSITGYQYVGGIIGYSSGSAIKNCSVTGTINATGDYAGGIVGYAESMLCVFNGTIYSFYSSMFSVADSYASVALTSSGGEAGGLIGSLGERSAVSYCYVAGSVDGGSGANVGGLAGSMGASSSISSSFALLSSIAGTAGSTGRIAGRQQRRDFKVLRL